MRLLIAVELLIVAGSAAAAWDLLGANAWNHPAPFDFLPDRQGELARSVFITEDPAERAERGERDRELGVALSGFDELVRLHPDDDAARLGRLRATMRLSGAGVGQQGLNELVFEQIKDYVARVDELDPDGEFMRPLLREWCDLRLQSPLLYNKASVAIWLAARGDPAGQARMKAFIDRGPFHLEFLPYAQKFHPGWTAVEPVVRHYLAHGDFLARVAAGAVLLDYHYLFGVGDDLYRDYLPAIRASFQEIKGKIGASQRDGMLHARGDVAIFAMGMLANRGFEEEKRTLATMAFLEFPHHTDTLRVARVLAGIRPFAAFAPGTENYKLLPIEARELYFRAVAHRDALLEEQGVTGGERDQLEDYLDYGFQSNDGIADLICWRALAAKDPVWTERAIDRRNLHATVSALRGMPWAEEVRRVGMYLASPLPDLAALSAVSLLDLGDTCAIMRPRGSR